MKPELDVEEDRALTKAQQEMEDRQFVRRKIAAGLDPDKFHTEKQIQDAEREIKAAKVREENQAKTAKRAARYDQILTEVQAKYRPKPQTASARGLDWKTAFKAEMQLGKSRHEAVLAVERKHPGLRESFIQSANQKQGGAQ